MTRTEDVGATLRELDDATRALVRLAAVVTAGTEADVRDAIGGAVDTVPDVWVEELLLQTYLFAGFPRALNSMREWRRVRPEVVVNGDRSPSDWATDGARTCEAVYGEMYSRLRRNIQTLHPLLDEWMINEGYGKVLSRPGLDLARRELCIVAACAAANQDRQLHSHLHGALNVGVSESAVDAAIDAIADLIGETRAKSVRLLWHRVKGK